MFKKIALLIASPLLVSLSSCGTERMSPDVELSLRDGEQFELLSLDPNPDAETDETFHEWAVMGKTKITDPAIQNKLATALKKGVSRSRGTVALCFMPRHGIRVIHENKVNEYVICFECLQAQRYIGGEQAEGFLLTEFPQPTFDQVLTEAGVRLPDPYIPTVAE